MRIGKTMLLNDNQLSNIRHQKRLRKRYNADFRFFLMGVMATLLVIVFLGWVMVTIARGSAPAFWQVRVSLDIAQSTVSQHHGYYDSHKALFENPACQKMLRQAAKEQLLPMIANATPIDSDKLAELIFGHYAYIDLCKQLNDHFEGYVPGKGAKDRLQIWLPASSEASEWYGKLPKKGEVKKFTTTAKEKIAKHSAPLTGPLGQLSDDSQRDFLRRTILNETYAQDKMAQFFNWDFLSMTDSREPELAGILGGLVGSLYTLLVCMAIAFPLGVATAIYLEEFAERTVWVKLIELNIQNLTAVPSIIFGVLGLSVYLLTLHLPRSSSLVGGVTLALMVLPLVVTTTRQALSVIPSSIREGVIALGATPIQMVLDHLVPLALPGILTGTILSICRALGETAPLLLIGMVAFIVNCPHTVWEPATALPVQVYLWSNAPESAFMAKTFAAILVLLVFLLAINMVAIIIRKRYTHRW
jgi:phosphate ABC transporter permease subunit PstA